MLGRRIAREGQKMFMVGLRSGRIGRLRYYLRREGLDVKGTQAGFFTVATSFSVRCQCLRGLSLPVARVTKLWCFPPTSVFGHL
jgi:hypothetical protein